MILIWYLNIGLISVMISRVERSKIRIVWRGNHVYVYRYKGQWDVSLYPIKLTVFNSGKTPRETQVHKQGRCVPLRLLWRPSREVFQVAL